MSQSRYLWVAVAAIAWGSGSGCRKDLQTVYGERSGPGATESVNGTAVFADMFEEAGHHVSSWGSLSPRLDKAECVVWFPNDFDPPSSAVIAWFERWLGEQPNRTLIYVGRDFDAVPWYWRTVEPAAPEDQREAIAKVRQEAEAAFQATRPKKTRNSCRWFAINYDVPAAKASNVTSDDLEWLQNLDVSGLEIECNSRMSPGRGIDTLLECDRGMLIGRLERGRSQLFVVANGSFLLNATLVNHEHRKLAGKLIDAIGSSGKEVVFLESGKIEIDQPDNPAQTAPPDPFQTGPNQPTSPNRPPESDNGPPIRRSDPSPETPTGLELLQVWPTNWILLHFAFLGILFCLWKLPIFGLPRPEDPRGASDFGRHVDAVAALLERTGDRKYANSLIKHYQQIVKKTD